MNKNTVLELGIVEFVKGKINAIEQDKLNCFISINKESSIAAANEIQKTIDGGKETSNFTGLIAAVDDNILTKNELSTAGSLMLSNFIPPYGATVVKKLSDAGVIIIGKTNVDEFGIGESNNSFKGSTKNPFDPNKVTSGGAASVKLGFADFALGSDSNGASRRLAAFTGATYVKPTYGTVSRFGLVANASSMEQIGVTANNAVDAFNVLSLISGYDENDGTSFNIKEYKYDFNSCDIKAMKIGVPRDYFNESLNSDVADAIQGFIKKLEELGAIIEEFDLPISQYAHHAYYIISSAEASNNISRFDGIKFGYRAKNFRGISDLYVKSRSESFGIETKKTSLMGAYVLSEENYEKYYIKSLKIRRLVKLALDDEFKKYDCIIAPVSATTAYNADALNDNNLAYLNNLYTSITSLAGIPVVSMPCGFDKDNMPIGVQLMAKSFDEQKLLDLSKCYQNVTDNHKISPQKNI